VDHYLTHETGMWNHLRTAVDDSGCPAHLNEAKAGICGDRWSCNGEARAKPW